MQMDNLNVLRLTLLNQLSVKFCICGQHHYTCKKKKPVSMSSIVPIIINTHKRFAIAFLPLTTRLSTELFEAVFIEKSSG